MAVARKSSSSRAENTQRRSEETSAKLLHRGNSFPRKPVTAAEQMKAAFSRKRTRRPRASATLSAWVTKAVETDSGLTAHQCGG